MLSGVCPGVWMTWTRTVPILISSPWTMGAWGKAASAAGWMWMRAPVFAAKAWLPERWSAWIWVSTIRVRLSPLRRPQAT